jgi:lipopolysaccharide transport system ATP-binding protein
MSSDTVIRVENLGKRYRIRHQAERQRYVALRDVLAAKGKSFIRTPWALVRHWFRQNGRASNSELRTPSFEDFWALRGVSFEVKRGEVVGIIGRNGAGKSTLLKILSRITEPTTGRVELDGRVASLLEVGTGFHPELTGRENIFLNGAILGMTRDEIKRKFDEIVAFAEIEKFLDTPVKHYSSGMYVRLAFAVAAHLEPEILIVDEVLAVGDMEFQKKCIGKMGEVSRHGRSVILVSHNMGLTQTVCETAIALERGRVGIIGEVGNVIAHYLSIGSSRAVFSREHEASKETQIVGCSVSLNDELTKGLLEVRIRSNRPRSIALDLRLADQLSIPVGFASLGTFHPDDLLSLSPGENCVRAELSIAALATGSYTVSLDLTIPFREYLDRVERCLSFEVRRPLHLGDRSAAQQGWGHGSYAIPMKVV